jgi:hypothetical protein
LLRHGHQPPGVLVVGNTLQPAEQRH